jgi:ribosomal-protein-alanine N-acetyltransferase
MLTSPTRNVESDQPLAVNCAHIRFQMELTGERILLREFEESDVGGLFAVHSDPRVLRYYAPEVGMPEHARMLVEMFIRWANENPRQNFQFAIIDLETNGLLGSCGIRRKGCPSDQAEFGIGIDADWWGRGIAQEAARIILRFGFSQLNLDQVHGVAVSENEAVAKFVRRLGFSLRTARGGDAWMAKRGWSAVDWVITRETWERLAG